jgi:maleylpyruvate isomerase
VTFDDDLDLLADATARLMSTANELDDEACRAPSRLPGWSRGHVLTHLARSADGLRNLTGWALTGVEAAMYPSWDARNAAIEAGAGRPAAELRADLSSSVAALAEAFAALEAPHRRVEVVIRGQSVPAEALPWQRLREVELHHVDLAAGPTMADVPSPVVRRLLDDLADRVGDTLAAGFTLCSASTGARWDVGPAPAVTIMGPEADLLAWSTGRGDGAALVAHPEGRLPEQPSWG